MFLNHVSKLPCETDSSISPRTLCHTALYTAKSPSTATVLLILMIANNRLFHNHKPRTKYSGGEYTEARGEVFHKIHPPLLFLWINGGEMWTKLCRAIYFGQNIKGILIKRGNKGIITTLCQSEHINHTHVIAPEPTGFELESHQKLGAWF